jgi:hypothetical protein
MPDLDQIKQGEQGAWDWCERLPKGGSSPVARSPRPRKPRRGHATPKTSAMRSRRLGSGCEQSWRPWPLGVVEIGDAYGTEEIIRSLLPRAS